MPPRAAPLWSERSERNRRGAQPRGWEGVGPQAVGCGLLLGSRGHPIPFAVTAQQAPCGRCIGRPAGAKRKRASPCGLALFEVQTLSRAALLGSTHMIPQPCVVVNSCFAVFRMPINYRADVPLPSEVALPPWGGRGVGLLLRRCRPVLCR